MSMLAGHAGARLLKDLGVSSVAGVAGESYLPLLEGLRREGIPFQNTAHEAGAVFLALGQARMSRQPGFAAVTRGPGATNAMIGVYEAMKSETPVVLLVGQVDTTLRHRNIIQEMEVVSAFGSVCKATIEVTRADRFAPALMAAYRTSLSGRQGPVVLSVPTDHLYGEAEPVQVPPALLSAGDVSPAHLGPTDLTAIMDALESAERGLLVLGRPFSRHRHDDVVEALSQQAGLGVIGGHSCLDVLDHRSDGWIGCSTVRSPLQIGRTLTEADLILLLGHQFGDRTSQGYVELEGRIMSIALDEMGVWDEYLGLERYAADPVSALEQLLAEFQRRSPDGRPAPNAWVSGVRHALRSSRDDVVAMDREKAGDYVPVSAVVETMDAVLPERSLIVSDVGTFNDWFTRYLPFPKGRSYLGPTANPMGCALPSAIGAHEPAGVDRTVVLVGDGGFLMSATELATLAQAGSPITVIVFVNGVWGSIARDQDNTYGERYGTEFGAPVDMVMLARSFGIEGRLLDDPSQIEDALTWSFSHDAPSLIEIRTNPHRLSPADLVG